MEENIEIWRDIPSYEGLYQVSNWGKVKSLPRNTTKGKILKQKKVYNGYLNVCLSKDGKRKYFTVHRLVCLAFLKNPENLPCVNHKNEIKTDNRLENLEFCDIQYNVTYNNVHIKRGEKMKGKKRSEETIQKMKKPILQFSLSGEFIKEFDSAKSASEELNVFATSITKCCKAKQNQCGGYKWVYKSDYKPTYTQLELQFD